MVTMGAVAIVMFMTSGVVSFFLPKDISSVSIAVCGVGYAVLALALKGER